MKKDGLNGNCMLLDQRREIRVYVWKAAPHNNIINLKVEMAAKGTCSFLSLHHFCVFFSSSVIKCFNWRCDMWVM